MKITNISEAKASLSKLVKKALQGEAVIIAKAGKPVASLVPFDRDITPRDLSQGIWQGQVTGCHGSRERFPESLGVLHDCGCARALSW
jgi:prevent-host-death family protein